MYLHTPTIPAQLFRLDPGTPPATPMLARLTISTNHLGVQGAGRGQGAHNTAATVWSTFPATPMLARLTISTNHLGGKCSRGRQGQGAHNTASTSTNSEAQCGWSTFSNGPRAELMMPGPPSMFHMFQKDTPPHYVFCWAWPRLIPVQMGT